MALCFLVNALFYALFPFCKETKSDRMSRPSPQLLFSIPDFLRSLMCCKTERWGLANESSPSHPSYNGNKAQVSVNACTV